MFNKQNFCHIASNNRNDVKAGVFVYKTTDDLATVSVSGYFNEKIIDINLHDLIIHEWHDPTDRTKVQYNLLCVTERTLDNVGTTIIHTKWDETVHDTLDAIAVVLNDLPNIYLKLDGTSVMSGPLKFRAGSFDGAIGGSLGGGVEVYSLRPDGSIDQTVLSITATDGVEPGHNNDISLGSNGLKWKNLYIAGRVYAPIINNGVDLTVPTPAQADKLALKSEVDTAANSGSQLTNKGVWYAKMYAATVVPTGAEYDGTNYADFSQTDINGDPIIVLYEGQNGAWVQTQTITPPIAYNGYVTITSKIWDIAEQNGQQGGLVLWAFNTKTFTPYPKIVSFEDAALTGTPTAPTLTTDSPTDQIVNKQALENKLEDLGTKQYTDDAITTVEQHLSDATQHVVTEFQAPSADNNYTWYKKYKDGSVEQGGVIATTSDAALTVNLPVTMADTNYTVSLNRATTDSTALSGLNSRWDAYWGKTTTSFGCWGKWGTTTELSWEVKGVAGAFQAYSYQTPGTYSLTLEPGTYRFELSAGGGGGGAALGAIWGSGGASHTAGASGGTGAYGSFEITVAATDTFTIVVGAGGTGATATNGTAASTAGGTTSISSTALGTNFVQLTGGGAGYAHATNNGDTATRGTAGTATTTLLTHNLSNGSAGSTATTSSGTRSATYTNNLAPYSSYGYGGGFAYNASQATMSATSGGNGYVYITQLS